MQILVKKCPPAVVLGINGHFNAASAPEFERLFNQCLEAGERRFVLNLAELTFISSAGLCSILAVAKKAREQGGNFVACNLRGEALKVFEISGFAALFSFFPSEAVALKHV